MPRFHHACLLAPGLLMLAGCVQDEAPPRATQVIVQPSSPPPPQMAVLEPGPPPPPRSELVPPPPAGAGPVVWQPGHWILSSNSWAWQPGEVCATATRVDDMGPWPLGAAAYRRMDMAGGALGLSVPLSVS